MYTIISDIEEPRQAVATIFNSAVAAAAITAAWELAYSTK
jgi:hypothetical protein